MFALVRLISIRHFFGSPLRSALTIFGVAVGVATLIGITAINRTVMNSFRSTIDTIAGKADMVVEGHAAPFPEEVLDQVRKIPGVAHAAGGLTAIAPVKGSPGESMYVLGVDFLDDGFFRTYEGVDRNVSQLNDDLEFLNSTDRMLVGERYAEKHNLKAGSTFELLTPDGAKTFIVHALLKETGPIKAFGGSVGVMFFGSAQEAFSKGRTFDRIDVAVTDKQQWDEIRDRIQAALGNAYDVGRPDSRGQSVETMVRSFQLGLNLGSGIALLVGIFLVYNTISIGVVQRRREIGTLRALGATRRRIRVLFAMEALVLGIVGSLLGVPVGIAIGRSAVSFVSDSVSAVYVRVNAKDITIGLNEILMGMAIGIGASVFAALRPAFVASAVPPIEALRRDVALGAGAVQLRSWPTIVGVSALALAYPATYLPPPVENFPLSGYACIGLILLGVTLLTPLVLRSLNGLLALIGNVLGNITGRLAADNFARAPLRTAVPVSALSIGVAMAVTIASFVGSFQTSTRKWIDQAIPADLFMTSAAKIGGVQNQPMNESLGDEVVKIPHVSAIDKIRLFQTDLMGLRIFVVSVIPEIYEHKSKPDVQSGKLPNAAERAEGKLAISENLARRRNLKVGSRFTMKTPTGDHEYTVAAIITDYTSDQGTLMMGREIYTQHFADTKVDSFHIYVDDQANLESVRSEVNKQFTEKYNLYVVSNAEFRVEALSMVENTFAITHAMEVVAVILALLGVINTLLAAVLDRTREIGLLRAVGAARKHIVSMISWEAAFIGLVGGVLGVLQGSVIGYVFTRVVGVEATGWNFPFVYPVSTALVMMTTATISALVAGLYPARRAAGLDVVEALAYE